MYCSWSICVVWCDQIVLTVELSYSQMRYVILTCYKLLSLISFLVTVTKKKKKTDHWCLILGIIVYLSFHKISRIQIILLSRLAVYGLCSISSHSHLLLFLIVEALYCVLSTQDTISELIAISIFLNKFWFSKLSFLQYHSKACGTCYFCTHNVPIHFIYSHTEYKLIELIFFIKNELDGNNVL